MELEKSSAFIFRQNQFVPTIYYCCSHKQFQGSHKWMYTVPKPCVRRTIQVNTIFCWQSNLFAWDYHSFLGPWCCEAFCIPHLLSFYTMKSLKERLLSVCSIFKLLVLFLLSLISLPFLPYFRFIFSLIAAIVT